MNWDAVSGCGPAALDLNWQMFLDQHRGTEILSLPILSQNFGSDETCGCLMRCRHWPLNMRCGKTYWTGRTDLLHEPHNLWAAYYRLSPSTYVSSSTTVSLQADALSISFSLSLSSSLALSLSLSLSTVSLYLVVSPSPDSFSLCPSRSFCPSLKLLMVIKSYHLACMNELIDQDFHRLRYSVTAHGKCDEACKGDLTFLKMTGYHG